MGVDQILDMGRTVTNVLGNGLATAAVARWQGEMQEEMVEVACRGGLADRQLRR